MALPDNPITRKEMYLAKIAGQEVSIPDVPITREEAYLDEIAKNGGGGGGYVLPTATASRLGGVKIGSGISVEEDGTISAEGGSSLEAGDYIDITEGVISVKKEKGEYLLERYVLQSTGGGAPKLVVKKYIDSELISTNEYANNTAHVNIDDTLEIWYSYNPYNWHYKLLVDGVDHSAGYEYEFSYDDTTEYPVDFHISAGDSTDLVTKGDLATVATSGSYNDLTDKLTFDNVPTDGSNNPVKSDGIYDSEKDIYAVMGQMGAKNLIPYPFPSDSYSQRGIEFTALSDGTITANGTNDGTGNSTFNFQKVLLSKGSYVINGCPIQTSTNYRCGVIRNSDSTTLASDYGSGALFTLDADTEVRFFVQVSSGKAANNIIFKPMLRLASDTDDTYQPYAKTNRELTDEIATKTKNFQGTIAEWNQLTTAEKKAYDHASIPDSIDGGVTFPANKVIMTGGGNVEDAIPLIRKGIFQVNGAGTTPINDTIVFSSPFPTATDIVLLSVRRDATDTSPENGVARVRMYSKNQFIYTFTGNNGSGYYVDYIAFGH